MKKLLLVLSLFLAGAILFNTQAQKLSSFNSTIEKKVGPKTIKVPYANVISYLGYAAKGNEDAVVDGKKFYYIYLWIPIAAPEIGIRMFSSAGDVKIKKNLIKSAEYEANAGSSDYFDTYITFERSEIVTIGGINEDNIENTTWYMLAKNDDSGELRKNPGGKKYNSLIRYESTTGDATKAITRGLYRVGFTTFKKGDVQGTFLAQIGAPLKLPGVGVAKTIDELLKQIEKE